MRSRITRRFDFHAAHALTTFPEGHKCRRLHGHTFLAEVTLAGEVDPQRGYLMDFGELKRHLAPLEADLDHANLNDLPGLPNPTTELLAKYIYDRLKPAVPLLESVRVHETPQNSSEYAGE